MRLSLDSVEGDWLILLSFDVDLLTFAVDPEAILAGRVEASQCCCEDTVVISNSQIYCQFDY